MEGMYYPCSQNKGADQLRGYAKAILMSTHNIGFYEDLTKIIFELSSNTHLISSADNT